MSILDDLSAFLKNEAHKSGMPTVPTEQVTFPHGPQNDFSRDYTPNNGGAVVSYSLPKLASAVADTPDSSKPSVTQVSDKPANGVITSQTLVGQALGADLLIPDRPQRLLVTIYNTDAAETVYLGASQAEANDVSGFPITAGGSITMAITCALYAQTSNAAVNVAVIEYVLTA